MSQSIEFPHESAHRTGATDGRAKRDLSTEVSPDTPVQQFHNPTTTEHRRRYLDHLTSVKKFPSGRTAIDQEQHLPPAVFDTTNRPYGCERWQEIVWHAERGRVLSPRPLSTLGGNGGLIAGAGRGMESPQAAVPPAITRGPRIPFPCIHRECPGPFPAPLRHGTRHTGGDREGTIISASPDRQLAPASVRTGTRLAQRFTTGRCPRRTAGCLRSPRSRCPRRLTTGIRVAAARRPTASAARSSCGASRLCARGSCCGARRAGRTSRWRPNSV